MAQFNDLLDGITVLAGLDGQLTGIIQEEAAGYFAGRHDGGAGRAEHPIPCAHLFAGAPQGHDKAPDKPGLSVSKKVFRPAEGRFSNFEKVRNLNGLNAKGGS